VAARPDDFSERLWLVRILMESGRQADAEAELRRAVELAPSDPVRWTTLVNFLIQTKQPAPAEKAIRDAEAKLPQAPLALALCCELLGRAYEGGDTDDSV
jgi:cellulose synthase operon protein C